MFFTLLVRIKATTLISLLLGLLENVCVFAFVVCVRACDHNFFPCVLTVVNSRGVTDVLFTGVCCVCVRGIL